ncbi:hypothetical protein KUTeg_018867 [Tegillarca granosa]|uniref:ShKT domain-containing protein n=1 Tax=Tegillarca granosa TaxID=220873 RepID=A0ABQ9EF43_TEGGR|nr:hypothetical protein KUTeg_018867 [Tegillarca granosa]
MIKIKILQLSTLFFVKPGFDSHFLINLFCCLCPIYTDLPSFCRLVKAAPGECCERVKCDQGTGSQTGGSSGGVTIPTTATPKPSCSWCKDNIDNCNAYGKSACQKPYVSWANRNCANYCDFCSMYDFK